MKKIKVNGEDRSFDSSEDTPLLWILRDDLQMTGTKFSCGMGLCGSCTVLVNGQPARSCITPVGSLADAEVTTIEGLSEDGSHPVQQAWREGNVPQCGYCQPGQIMSAVGLLNTNSNPDRETIRSHMSGNLCRCGTYPRIEKAIVAAAALQREGKE